MLHLSCPCIFPQTETLPFSLKYTLLPPEGDVSPNALWWIILKQSQKQRPLIPAVTVLVELCIYSVDCSDFVLEFVILQRENQPVQIQFCWKYTTSQARGEIMCS